MIIVNLDIVLAKRKMSLTELSQKVGITMANLSILKKGKAKAIRFTTLESICKVLECQPGDILEFSLEGKKSLEMKTYKTLILLLALQCLIPSTISVHSYSSIYGSDSTKWEIPFAI